MVKISRILKDPFCFADTLRKILLCESTGWKSFSVDISMNNNKAKLRDFLESRSDQYFIVDNQYYIEKIVDTSSGFDEIWVVAGVRLTDEYKKTMPHTNLSHYTSYASFMLIPGKCIIFKDIIIEILLTACNQQFDNLHDLVFKNEHPRLQGNQLSDYYLITGVLDPFLKSMYEYFGYGECNDNISSAIATASMITITKELYGVDDAVVATDSIEKFGEMCSLLFSHSYGMSIQLVILSYLPNTTAELRYRPGIAEFKPIDIDRIAALTQAAESIIAKSERGSYLDNMKAMLTISEMKEEE